MGNDITKGYDMPPESSASGGPDGVWKLYPAQQKATGLPVTVFVLQKDSAAFKKVDKAKAEQIFQLMRKEIKNLQAQGHGRILRILEVFEENKKVLAFVSERVVCSLADFHSRFHGIPSDRVSHELRQMKLTEMEIGRGLFNIAEALQYLHNVGRRVHMDVCPENIFLSPQGQWKLGGLGFALGMESGSSPSPYFVRDPERLPFRVEPSISYSAPETVVGAVGRSVTARADMFAVGVLAIEAFTAQSQGYLTAARPVIAVPNSAPSMYEGALSASLNHLDLNSVPMNFRNVLSGLLAREPSTRIDTSTMLSSPYFHTGAVALLCAVDTIQERDVPSQASFLSALPAQLHLFEARILKHSILPTVCRACFHSPSLWDFGLAAIETIAGSLTNDEFQKSAQPYFAKALGAPHSVDALKAFVKHAHWIVSRADPSFFREHFLAALLVAVESPESQLQIDALKMLADSNIIDDLDGSSLEHAVVPAVCKASVKTQLVAVRVQTLVVLSKTLSKLPQMFLVKAILPTLKVVRERDNTPAVAMCVLGCYERIAELVGPETICQAILPHLLALLYDKQLNAKQFEMVSLRVRNLLARVLQARHSDLGLPPPDMAVTPMSPTRMEPEVATPARAPPPVPKKAPSIPNTPPVDASPASMSADPFKDQALADTMKTSRAPPPVPSQPPQIPAFSPPAASSADIDALFANLETKAVAGGSNGFSTQSAPQIAVFDPSDPFAGLSFADSLPPASTAAFGSSGAMANGHTHSDPFTPAPAAAAPAVPQNSAAYELSHQPPRKPAATAKQAPQVPKIAPPREYGSTRLAPPNATPSTSAQSLPAATPSFTSSADLFSGLAVSPTSGFGGSMSGPTQPGPAAMPSASTRQAFPAASGMMSSSDPFAGLDFTASAGPMAASSSGSTTAPTMGYAPTTSSFGGSDVFGMQTTAPMNTTGSGFGGAQPHAGMNMGMNMGMGMGTPMGQGMPMGAPMGGGGGGGAMGMANAGMGFPMMGGGMPMAGMGMSAPQQGMNPGFGGMGTYGGAPAQGQTGQWPANMGFMQGFPRPPTQGQR